jgi:hypothetical protein
VNFNDVLGADQRAAAGIDRHHPDALDRPWQRGQRWQRRRPRGREAELDALEGRDLDLHGRQDRTVGAAGLDRGRADRDAAHGVRPRPGLGHGGDRRIV